MRDLFLLAALLITTPLIVRAPVIGLLAWIWITLMNPQREVYGFLSGFGLNLYIALLTILAWFASKERKAPPPNLVTLGLIAFAAWSTLTTFTAFDRPHSLKIWDLTIKSIFLAVVVATLVNTKARLQAAIWVIMVSIGYYAIKGGGFVLLTGGQNHVYGAEDSMLADNNALGLVLLMFLPLFDYLRRTSRLAITRLACLATIAFTVIAAIGTYSRGALITLAAVAATYAIRTRAGVVVALVGGVLAFTLPSLLPDAWLERMSTIGSYEEDDSFNGRVAAWKTNMAIAAERPLLGGGFYACNLDWVAKRYSQGELEGGLAAHSIYFEVIGDHGFAGFGIYLLVLAAAWVNTWLVLNLARAREDLAWARELARMLQVSLVGFMVGGAALSMAYYDGAFIVLALTAALLQVARRPAESAEAPSLPRWRAIGAAAPGPRPAQEAASSPVV